MSWWWIGAIIMVVTVVVVINYYQNRTPPRPATVERDTASTDPQTRGGERGRGGGRREGNWWKPILPTMVALVIIAGSVWSAFRFPAHHNWWWILGAGAGFVLATVVWNTVDETVSTKPWFQEIGRQYRWLLWTVIAVLFWQSFAGKKVREATEAVATASRQSQEANLGQEKTYAGVLTCPTITWDIQDDQSWEKNSPGILIPNPYQTGMAVEEIKITTPNGKKFFAIVTANDGNKQEICSKQISTDETPDHLRSNGGKMIFCAQAGTEITYRVVLTGTRGKAKKLPPTIDLSPSTIKKGEPSQ